MWEGRPKGRPLCIPGRCLTNQASGINLRIYVTLSDKLRRLRNTRKLTLREVEHQTGISNAYLSQLENGRAKNPSLAVLRSLAGVYRVTVDMLVTATPPAIVPDSRRTTAGIGASNLTHEEENRLSEFIQSLLAERERRPSRKR